MRELPHESWPEVASVMLAAAASQKIQVKNAQAPAPAIEATIDEVATMKAARKPAPVKRVQMLAKSVKRVLASTHLSSKCLEGKAADARALVGPIGVVVVAVVAPDDDGGDDLFAARIKTRSASRRCGRTDHFNQGKEEQKPEEDGQAACTRKVKPSGSCAKIVKTNAARGIRVPLLL
jgi:hypothetical protein